jgi:hypothetical protein
LSWLTESERIETDRFDTICGRKTREDAWQLLIGIGQKKGAWHLIEKTHESIIGLSEGSRIDSNR